MFAASASANPLMPNRYLSPRSTNEVPSNDMQNTTVYQAAFKILVEKKTLVFSKIEDSYQFKEGNQNYTVREAWVKEFGDRMQTQYGVSRENVTFTNPYISKVDEWGNPNMTILENLQKQQIILALPLLIFNP